MTTLIEAAQALVAEIKSADVPWRIAKLLPELKQAIAHEQKPKFTRFEVLVITTAYEQGYGKGLQDRGVPNVYVQDSPAFHAWQLGYEEGQMRLKQQGKESKLDGYEDILNVLKDERFSI